MAQLEADNPRYVAAYTGKTFELHPISEASEHLLAARQQRMTRFALEQQVVIGS
jgi:hypothetical protein